MTSPGEPAATGRRLGLQLRAWIEAEPERLRSTTAIANRLIDALGADDSLRVPIRDLTSRPQLLQALHSQGASRKAAVSSLSQQLAQTYAPAVLGELLALLEAATGEELAKPTADPAPLQPLPAVPRVLDVPAAAGPITATITAPAAATSTATGNTTPERLAWRPLLHAIAPGVALAASAALVFSWLAQELDRGLFDGWGWSGGVVLVLVLGLLQALAIGPLRGLRRRWSLSDRQAIQPRHAWRWIGSSWIHANGIEACLNLLLLLILVGDSPLPLAQVVLRYGLTALACLIPAALIAHRAGVRRRWSGASGPLSALIALAAGLSLLHWRAMGFATPLATIPAWVLLLIYGALQLSWQLPRLPGDHHTTPWERLLSSSWGWGLILGLGWALVSRVRELL
ncbi:MAG: rhomboid family intramembrane serine protease [Vulcanococcus sp.]